VHEPKASAPTPNASRQAEVKKRLTALVGPYKEAVAFKGPNVAKMQSLMADVKTHATKGDFEQASKKLDELEPLVKGTRGLGAAAKLAEETLKAAVTNRLAALIGPYKEAVSRNGPAAAEMRSHMDAAKKHIIERNFEQAAKDLDELRPLVEQANIRNRKGVMTEGGTSAATATANSNLITAGASPPASAVPASWAVTDSEHHEEPLNPIFQTNTMSAAPAARQGGTGGKHDSKSPSPKPTPQNTPWQQIHDTANDYSRRVQHYTERVAAVKERRRALQSELTGIENDLGSGKIGSLEYFRKLSEYEGKQTKFTGELDSLDREGRQLRADGEEAASRVEQAGKAGTADPFRGSGPTPKELVSNARKALDSSTSDLEGVKNSTRNWPRGSGQGGGSSGGKEPTDVKGGTQKNKNPQTHAKPTITKDNSDPNSGGYGGRGSGGPQAPDKPPITSDHDPNSGGGPGDRKSPSDAQHGTKGKGEPNAPAKPPDREGTGDPNKGGGHGDSGGGSGAGGPPKTPADQVEQWAKQGKITGDVAGLQDRLASSNKKTVREAERVFNEARQAIEKGGKYNVKNQGSQGSPRNQRTGQDAPKTEGMSTPGKTDLGKIPMVKTLVPDNARQAALGKWIEANHDEVAKIATRLGVKGWTGVQDGHGHLTKRPDFVEEVVREWQNGEGATGMTVDEMDTREKRDRSWKPNEEQRKKLEQARSKKGGGGTGGSGGHEPTKKGGGAGGAGKDGSTGGGKSTTRADEKAKTGASGDHTAKGGADAKPGGTTAPGPDNAWKSVLDKAQESEATVKKLQESAEVLRKRQAKEGRSKQIADELAKIQKESKAATDEIKAKMKEVANRGAKELEAEFGTAEPKELLKRARAKGGSKGGWGRAAFTLANAFALAQGLDYILQADTKLEKLSRAVEVGEGYASSAAATKLATVITGSSGVGFVVGSLLTVSTDQAPHADYERAKKLDLARQDHEHARRAAIGAFARENTPVSVGPRGEHAEEFLEPYEALYQETEKAVMEMERQQVAKNRAARSQRARELGIKDGKIGGQVHKDEVAGLARADWEEVTVRGLKGEFAAYRDNAEKEHLEAYLPVYMEAYLAGYRQGVAKIAKLLERASSLGASDGKTGRNSHKLEMYKWPEVEEAIKEGADARTLLERLADHYNRAFDFQLPRQPK
jgi:hypothetical protein